MDNSKIENKMHPKKQNKLAASVAGLISLSFGLSAMYFTGGLQSDAAAQSNSRNNIRTAPVIRHELVPHIVLPESIEYRKTAKSSNAADACFGQPGGVMVSPFVATYTPFPSYQVPATTSFQPAGQSVYPVIERQTEAEETLKADKSKVPQRLPLQKQLKQTQPAPELQEPATLTKSARKLLKYFEEDPSEAEIQLVSNNEEVIPAVPYSELDGTIEQTGLFCQKPAKPPAAWSFNSPLFKAANVPTGWNSPQFNASITQGGRFGFSQVGFGPAGQQAGIPPQGYPVNTFGMSGFGGTDSNGVSVQQLPNGMLLMTAPSDHANCGLLRCRCGGQPKMMLLPPAPLGQNPLPNPAGVVPAGDSTMMNPLVQQLMQQQFLQQQYTPQQYIPQQIVNQPAVQMMPVTAATPYGLAVVGYQAVPVAPNQYAGSPYMIPTETINGNYGSNGNTGTGLQPPMQLPANGLGAGLNTAGLIATPYGVYAQHHADTPDTETASHHPADAKTTDEKTNVPLPAANTAAQNAAQNNVNPFGYYPMIMFQPPQYGNLPYGNPQYGNSHCGLFGQNNLPVYNNPPAYYAAPFGYGGNGFVNAGLMNCSAGGFGGSPFGDVDMTANVTRSDLLTMMMIMSQQQHQNQRVRLFQRISERRESRRQNRSGGAAPDLMQQLIQAWSTPYIAPDTAFRMPSRNMYPYGYFGAQPGGVQTANYGGFYNLSMGNTAYPGLY